MNDLTRHSALPAPAKRLLSRPESAAYVGVSPNTFDRLMGDGLMPGPVRVYTRTLWDVRALDAAIDDLPREGHDGGVEKEEFNEWDDA